MRLQILNFRKYSIAGIFSGSKTFAAAADKTILGLDLIVECATQRICRQLFGSNICNESII